MRRTAFASAIAALVFLAGCNGSAEPSAPPTSEDALTTATTDPVATTEEPTEGDEAAVTTEAAATTQLPTADDGPPEMPQEAREQSETGAEAFAVHYLDVLNYTAQHPQVGLIEQLSGDDCASCQNHAASVAYGVENGDYLDDAMFILGEPTSIFTGTGSRVSVPVEQPAQAYLRDARPIDRELAEEHATFVVRVVWSDGWLVDEVTVEQ